MESSPLLNPTPAAGGTAETACAIVGEVRNTHKKCPDQAHDFNMTAITAGKVQRQAIGVVEKVKRLSRFDRRVPLRTSRRAIPDVDRAIKVINATAQVVLSGGKGAQVKRK